MTIALADIASDSRFVAPLTLSHANPLLNLILGDGLSKDRNHTRRQHAAYLGDARKMWMVYAYT